MGKIITGANNLVLLFSLTLFINAALLFIIEPMVAKMILPYLGGSPAVWNTSLVFYQGCLLAGYAYAHFGDRWLGPRRHAVLHLTLVLTALFFLPITIPMSWFSTPTENPSILVLRLMFMSIGFPFLVVASGGPLLQKWFAYGQRQASRDPYSLYIASNCGSLIALLAYPLVLERSLTLAQQNQIWFFSYLALLVLLTLCAPLYLRPFPSVPPVYRSARPIAELPALDANDDNTDLSIIRRLRWLVWSWVPASLLSGVTSYITTDVVAAPLFWVIPLALYLLSFIIAFARPAWTLSSFFLRRQAFLLLGSAVTVAVHANNPSYIVLPLHLLAFLATATVCHGRLASDRPSPVHLTSFYLWISMGGLLGGLFNALIAPQVFSGIYEYPIAMATAAFVRPYVGARVNSTNAKRLDWLLPLALTAVMLVILFFAKIIPGLAHGHLHVLIFGLTGVLCLSFAYRPVRFGVGFIAVSVIAASYPQPYGKVLLSDRSFFGAYRATDDVENHRHLMFHGTTIHGAQNFDPSTRLQPLSYYHRTGPAGQVLLTHSKTRLDGKVGIVGLGTGALACHGSPGQEFTFYEIDPLIEKIARDEQLFTYLRDCPPHIKVMIGDARISLTKAPDRYYDLFVLDAFSSDVIPVHLLTREALELYLSKTGPDGLLLFHISNRYMDLVPVLARLAVNLRLVAYLQADFDISPQDAAQGKTASRWILMARNQSVLAPYVGQGRWRALDEHAAGDLWTDEFSDVLKIIYWQ